MVIEHLIDGLKRKHAVLLLTPDTKYKRKGVRVVDINQDFQSLDRIVKEFGPDVINCHTFYFFDLAKKLAVSGGFPLVTTLHGMFLRFYGKDYRSLIRAICDESDAVTVVSGGYKKELIKSLSVNAKNIHVIKNGIPNAEVDLRGDIKKKLRMPTEKKLVVVPSRISKIKGLEYLLKAARRLQNDKWFFLVCTPEGRSGNAEETELRKSLDKLNVPKDTLRIEVCSHSDLQKIYLSAELCLLPSLMEGISISLLEAMQAGCLVAATRVGGNVELISNGKDGYLFAPRSVRAIVDLIYFLGAVPETQKKSLIARAAKKVRQDFSGCKMIQSYEDLFASISNQHEIKQ